MDNENLDILHQSITLMQNKEVTDECILCLYYTYNTAICNNKSCHFHRIQYALCLTNMAQICSN